MRGKKEEKNVENIALGPERYLKPNLEQNRIDFGYQQSRNRTRKHCLKIT